MATFALAEEGCTGLIMGLGIVLFMVMALGISAVLLSINDHLAAARPTSVSEASYSTEMRPTNGKAKGGSGALELAAIVISADRKRVVSGKGGAVRGDIGVRRSSKKKQNNKD